MYHYTNNYKSAGTTEETHKQLDLASSKPLPMSISAAQLQNGGDRLQQVVYNSDANENSSTMKNAKATPTRLGHLHSAGHVVSEEAHLSTPSSVAIHTAESSAGSTTALPSSPLLSGVLSSPATTTGSSRSSGSVSIAPAPTRTRVRTTSSNSVSTISATRYQIATSILQPTEPVLTDVAQPTILSPMNSSLLGEPALSTIAASAPSSSSNPNFHEKPPLVPQLAESNKILISKLLSLSNTFKGSIKALYEQQNEKVLRFDDYVILDLLTQWEQEAEWEDRVPDSEETGATSLVTISATNALERYQITVRKMWDETNIILLSILKIRELVELGRIQHESDFDANDSEEDAVERDEETKRTLYSKLLLRANSLVTVLGEFLECVSGIQRLVGNIKSQGIGNISNHFETRTASEGVRGSVIEFIPKEPRPVKHLDPALMLKLKRKTPFKSIADKVRRSISDLAKKSQNQLLTIFPPLGDGTNEGFNWDSYSDNEYDSEEWAPTDMENSVLGSGEIRHHPFSPPESPSVLSEKPLPKLHRRLSFKDAAHPLPEQYWPGSMKLCLSDDSLSSAHPSSPTTTISTGTHGMGMSWSPSSERPPEMIDAWSRQGLPETPPAFYTPSGSSDPTSYFPNVLDLQPSPVSPGKPENKEGRRSIQLFRRNSNASTFTGASISAPIPVPSRPLSIFGPGSEFQPPSRHNYKARPPRPPVTLPPLPPSPVRSPSSLNSEETILQDTVNFKPKLIYSRSSPYLTARNNSPLQTTPPTLDSHFVRQTSIRMANRNRYSIKMPSDDVTDPEALGLSNNSPSIYWRRRSFNDALEKSWQALQLDTISSRVSESSAQSTPVTSEFSPGARSSARLSSGEMPRLYGYRDNSNRFSAGSISYSPNRLSERFSDRRHSSPLTPSTEVLLAEALSRRTSVSSQLSLTSGSQSSTNRDSIDMMPTLDEDFIHNKPIMRPMRSTDHLNFIEVDTLNIPPRQRLFPREGSSEIMRTAGKPPSSGSMETDQGFEQNAPKPRKHPISSSRYSDMRRAWEILSLDTKRLNQYSDMRVYAKPNGQNNSWAYNHPNAHRSASQPRALLIRENGVDVLVLEKIEEERLQVVAGVLDNLIERLADQNEQDGEYVSCFLLTHSFFINSEELLDRLIARFHIKPSAKEPLYFEQWHKVIQCKVLCVINRWIQIQFEDFEVDQDRLKKLKEFLEIDVRNNGFMIEADCIEKNISIRSRSPKKNCSVIMEQGRFCLQRTSTRTRKIGQARTQAAQSPTSSGMTSTPVSPTEQLVEYGLPPEPAPSSPIQALTALELARYLTLADMKAFRCITVYDLMAGLWKRRQSAEHTEDGEDNDLSEDGAIEAFTRRANMLRYWVAHEILSLASTKHRKQLIKKFIEVAKICRDLNNFHTCMFITLAIISSPVKRLHSTWKLVSSTDMETLRQLEKLLDTSGNMRYYRQIIEEAQAPAIPFLHGNSTMITSKSGADPTPPVSSTTIATGSLDAPNMKGDSVSSSPDENNNNGNNDSNNKSRTEKSLLVNFEKFRQLTQYVEKAVDSAKILDYWFEPQLLRQARVFRPTTPSMHGHPYDSDSVHGSTVSGRGSNINSPSPLDSSRGPLDHVSEIVERRLVKASGLYEAHQNVVEVEFSSKPKNTSLWKGVVNVGSGHNANANGSSMVDTVIRAVQGEEEYLKGLSYMCEPK
ncbi:hypothetical protein BGZ76_003573 [Entomortierella beljakovae]|nr:hypothetical protein BGZ76_003573 [Entomortierella beljakovae]